MTASLQLVNQTAIVTGAGSGIGNGVALGLADAQASAVINDVGNQDHANAVVDSIRGRRSHAIAVPADVSREDDVRRLFEQTVQEEFGLVDILVAKAGVQQDARLTETTFYHGFTENG